LNIIANTQHGFIIKNGLEPGTQIVLEGVTKIKDGMTISPVK
jgi:membrane fusion protein (multidrug efflux system)